MCQTWYTFLLLQWTILNYHVQPKSTNITHHHTALTILYLTDSPLEKNTEELFAKFLRAISNGTNIESDVKLRSLILPNNSVSLLSILRNLNSSLSWQETSVIILDVDEDKVKAISLFSCFGLLFDIRTRPNGEDKLFPKTLTVKPSITRLHEAIERMFGEIGWTKMAEIKCYSRDGQDIEKMKQQLNNIKKRKFTFIFVKCLENLDLILKYGKTIGLTNSEYRWVFPGILSLQDIRVYLPKNVIGVDLPGSSIRYDSTAAAAGHDLFLKDVFSVLEKILKENSQKLCKNWSSKSITTFLRRCMIDRDFPGYTGDVIFNSEGERSGESYEIFELIILDGDYQWLSIGSLERGNVNILFNHWRVERNEKVAKTPVLRVVTLKLPPWLMYTSEKFPSLLTGNCTIGRLCRRYTNVTQSTTSYQDYCCTGLAIELLDRLEIDATFRGVVHIVKDGHFGSNDPKTHQWNGMIGELIRNEADIAVSSLTITAKRSKVVDFTYPYLEAANGILVSTQPASHTLWDFVFLDTFSLSLWVALFITVQVVIVILWLTERLRQRRRYIKDPFKRDNSMSYSDIINYTWSLLFQKASEEVGPSTLGGRTVAALFAFSTIIACSSFTANLAAIKVSERNGISISGIHDSKFQNGNGDFRFGTIAHSANLDFFRDSSDERFQRIYRKIRNNVIPSTTQGAAKVADGEWTAYIDDIPQLNYMVSKQTDCKLKIVGEPFFFSGYGFALQMNSTWNARISLIVTKLVREGFIQQLQSKWMPSACGDPVIPGTEKLSLNDIGGALVLVALGCVVSGLILSVEYVIWRAKAGRARPINDDQMQNGDMNQTLNSLTKIFALWQETSSISTRPSMPAEATLSNFRTLTQRKHLGDCASESSNAKYLN